MCAADAQTFLSHRAQFGVVVNSGAIQQSAKECVSSFVIGQRDDADRAQAALGDHAPPHETFRKMATGTNLRSFSNGKSPKTMHEIARTQTGPSVAAIAGTAGLLHRSESLLSFLPSKVLGIPLRRLGHDVRQRGHGHHTRNHVNN